MTRPRLGVGGRDRRVELGIGLVGIRLGPRPLVVGPQRVWTESVRRDVPEALFEHRRGGRVVAVGVGDEQVRDPFALHGADERVDMRLVARARRR